MQSATWRWAEQPEKAKPITSQSISCWGFNISRDSLRPEELAYIENLPPELPTIEWIWREMDRVWEEHGLDNTKPLESQPIAKYYGHPIWLVNGIFTALDTLSAQHRASIARCLADTGASDIADYGGGFGELAIAIHRAIPDARVTIIEPYPTQVSMERLREIGPIAVRSSLGSRYDAVVAQDVLEHVEDPVGLAYQMADSVREGGEVIFANCFRPVIKCHLPCTFHLKYTFSSVMSLMGLRYKGKVEGATHALLFERCGTLNLPAGRRAERVSKTVFSGMALWRKAVSIAKRK